MLAHGDAHMSMVAAAAAAGTARRERRLLFVVNDTRFFVSHRLPLGAAARRAGYEVHLAALPDGKLDVLAAHGIVFHPLRVDRTGLNAWRELDLLRQLAGVIRRVDPDTVHCVTIKPVIYGGLLCRLLGVPAFVAAVSGLGYVFVARGASSALLRPLIRRLYRFVFSHPNSRVIFQNGDDRAELAALGLVRAERSVLIRGSGVDPTVYRPRPEPEGTPVVLLPARLLREKGIGEFVAAARLVGPVARFVLVGDAPAHNRSCVPAAALQAWRDEGVVEWWGHREDMPEVYAAASIVCLPSHREGLPKALLEAAACARPIVATDVPGCREVCRHGENGLLVPPRDPATLAAALAALLRDPALRRAMGERGREIALREFTVARVAERTLAVYRALEQACRGATGQGHRARRSAEGAAAVATADEPS